MMVLSMLRTIRASVVGLLEFRLPGSTRISRHALRRLAAAPRWDSIHRVQGLGYLWGLGFKVQGLQ